MAKTLDQLLLEPIHATYFIVKPLLPVGGMMLVAGPEKSFKSMLTRNMAYQLAEGLPFLGNEYWKVEKPQTVLLIEQEVGEYEERDRLNRIHASLIGSVAGENLRVVSKDLSISLDTPTGMDRLLREIESTNPGVLILDPIREFHGKEENASTDMRNVLLPLRRYLGERHIALIVVHHTSKPNEYRSASLPNAARGSNYLAAAANTIIMIEKPVPNKDEIIRLHFTLRSAKKPFPLTLEFDETSGTFRSRA